MKRILVIEDCVIFRGVVKLLLAKYPFEVDFRCSVEEVDTSTCPTLAYDLVLSDYNLPGRRGFDFLKQLKEEGAQSIPLIMMTANRKAQKECPDLGNVVDALLLKPFTRYTLERVLTESFGAQSLLAAS